MIGERWSNYRQGLVARHQILNPENPTYRWLVLSSVMIATFMAVLDATVVNVALPKLMASFGVSVDRVEWVLTGYLLVFAVVLPSSGWFADHFGQKRIFLLGLLFFTFGSFLCSLSWSLNILIAFRILQGAGAGFLMPVGMAIILREFPPEKRGIALGFWAMAASASVSLGPTLGGYLIDTYSWHMIFDVNVPVGIFGMIVLLIVLREYKTEEIRSFDLVGFISLTVFLTTLLLALANGNSDWNTGGWTSTYILTCFGISAVSLIIFLTAEFNARHPILDLSLLKSRNFAIGNMVFFIFGLGVFGSIFLLPLYLQNSLGYTPLQAGLVFLPVGLIQGISAPTAGIFSDKVGPRIPVYIGLLLMALSFYLYGHLSFLTERPTIMLALYIRGIAIGFLFASLTTLAIAEIPNPRMAQAAGMLNVIRQIGASLGVAIFGSFLVRRTIYHSAMYGGQIDAHSAVYNQTLYRLQHFAEHAVGSSPGKAAAQAKGIMVGFVQSQAFIRAVSDVFLTAGAVILLSIVPLFFLRSRRKAKAQAAPPVKPAPVEEG